MKYTFTADLIPKCTTCVMSDSVLNSFAAKITDPSLYYNHVTEEVDAYIYNTYYVYPGSSHVYFNYESNAELPYSIDYLNYSDFVNFDNAVGDVLDILSYNYYII